MAVRRRKRKRNPVDPEHVYHEAIAMVEEEFEECAKRVVKKLNKMLGEDNDLIRDALSEGHDQFVEEWQLN